MQRVGKRLRGLAEPLVLREKESLPVKAAGLLQRARTEEKTSTRKERKRLVVGSESSYEYVDAENHERKKKQGRRWKKKKRVKAGGRRRKTFALEKETASAW